MRLADRVAIVTGGAHGIGAAIARELAGEGAPVAIIDIDGPLAGETAASIGGRAIAVRADASDEAEMVRVIDDIAERFDGLDILVNNAGAGKGAAAALENEAAYGVRAEALSQREWDEQVAQNLRTTFVCSKAAIPHLKARGSGSIVNIASVAALVASPTLPAYAAAKAGVISLTKSLALELAPHDVRVNAICPGLLWTRAWEMLAKGIRDNVPAFAGRELRDIFLDIVRRSVPLGREQTPEDIGKLTVFLCSDDARNITGQWISVDGGITLRGG